MPIIVEDEDKIIDVIYERVCGYKLSEAVQILEKYRTKKLIPVEWIEKWGKKFYKNINGKTYYTGDGYDTAWDLLEDWEKENENL